jgi:hypothetical protein
MARVKAGCRSWRLRRGWAVERQAVEGMRLVKAGCRRFWKVEDEALKRLGWRSGGSM